MATQIDVSDLKLTAEEELAARRIYDSCIGEVEQKVMRIARSMAVKKPEELLGRGEFELRDRMHEIGAVILQTVVNEAAEKKGRLRGC